MIQHALFDSFFAPTRVIVVSEERLKQAELEAKQQQIEAVEVRINELTQYRDELTKQFKNLTPAKSGKDLDQLDGAECDV